MLILTASASAYASQLLIPKGANQQQKLFLFVNLQKKIKNYFYFALLLICHMQLKSPCISYFFYRIIYYYCLFLSSKPNILPPEPPERPNREASGTATG